LRSPPHASEELKSILSMFLHPHALLCNTATGLALPQGKMARLMVSHADKKFLCTHDEDISNLWICYPLARESHPRSEGNDDHPSATLSLLPRDRYCQAWKGARRQATLPMPGVSPGTPDLHQVKRALLVSLHPEYIEVKFCRADELEEQRGLHSELDEMWSYVVRRIG
jgi:hypothetical protein